MGRLIRWIPVALIGGGICQPLMAAEALPNILVIVVDDAGYSDFGFMGSKDLPTPRIDQLASLGTVLTDGHVTATVCSPSRAGLMTGRYQQRFGHECNVPPDDQGMDPREMTMADLLKARGYRTICIGKWHLGNRTMYHPNNRGFDQFWGFLEGARSYFPDARVDRPENFRAILDNREQVDFDGYLTDVFTDKAIEQIRESRDKPWFLYLSYNAVHTPMEAKAEDLERFAGHARPHLAAMTWSLDENIGRLVDALEVDGEMDNTLVFFLSDNGGAGAHNNQSSNAPLKGWKGNKFEGGHRVPFFVVWEGKVPAGVRFDGLCSSLDILATALAAAGAEAPGSRPLDGIDLVPILASGVPVRRQLYWRKDRMAAMRDGPYKLIRLEGMGYRLYDLSADLGETVDVRDQYPDQFRAMVADLVQWDRELVSPMWVEDEAWSAVTYEIHRALMQNEVPRYRTPAQKAAVESR
jgi:arylsulfatase A-like enzyme